MMDGNSPIVERRRHPRTLVQMDLQSIRLDPSGGDVVDRLRMVDISRSGMGAVCDRAFYPGQRLVVCMPLSETGGHRNIYATVVRCRPRHGSYRVGMEFDTVSVGSWYGMGGASSTAAA